MPELSRLLIQRVLKLAPRSCWLVVHVDTLKILGTGPNPEAALEAAQDRADYGTEKVTIIWSPGKQGGSGA